MKSSPRLQSLTGGLLLVLIVLAPLIASRVFLCPMPQGDTWRTILEFREWTEGEMTTAEVLGRHGPHPGALLRPVTFALLIYGNGDLSTLTIFSWAISVGALAAVILLTRQSRHPDEPKAANWPLLVIAASCLFSLSQSFSWTWEFLWVNWIPGASLAAALAVNGARREHAWWRWPALVLFAAIAMVGFGNGPFAWFLIACGWAFQRLFTPETAASPTIFRPGWIAIVGWVLAWGTITVATLPGSESEGMPGELPSLAGRVGVAAHYFLYLMGSIVGKGTAVPATWQGAALGLLFLSLFLRGCWILWQRRADGIEVARLLPWVQLGLFSAFTGILIAAGRMGNTLDTALAPRYVTLTLWMPLSALVLTWFTRRSRPSESPVSSRLPFLAGGLAVLLIASSLHGIREMRYHYRLRLGHTAALQFNEVLPESALRVISPWAGDDSGSLMVELARFLEERNRLPIPKFFDEAEVRELKVLSTNKEASLTVVPNGSGSYLAFGHARLNGLTTAPDLILVAAVPGRVSDEEFPALATTQLVGLARPDLPEEFFFADQGRRRHPELFYRWQAPLETGRLPEANELSLRAYVYDYGARRLRPFPEVVVIDQPGAATP